MGSPRIGFDMERPGSSVMGPLGGPDLYPVSCECMVGRIEFNSDEVSTQTTCGNQCRPGAAERIKNEIAFR
jgi:hypothetical protein